MSVPETLIEYRAQLHRIREAAAAETVLIEEAQRRVKQALAVAEAALAAVDFAIESLGRSSGVAPAAAPETAPAAKQRAARRDIRGMVLEAARKAARPVSSHEVAAQTGLREGQVRAALAEHSDAGRLIQIRPGYWMLALKIGVNKAVRTPDPIVDPDWGRAVGHETSQAAQ